MRNLKDELKRLPPARVYRTVEGYRRMLDLTRTATLLLQDASFDTRGWRVVCGRPPAGPVLATQTQLVVTPGCNDFATFDNAFGDNNGTSRTPGWSFAPGDTINSQGLQFRAITQLTGPAGSNSNITVIGFARPLPAALPTAQPQVQPAPWEDPNVRRYVETTSPAADPEAGRPFPFPLGATFPNPLAPPGLDPTREPDYEGVDLTPGEAPRGTDNITKRQPPAPYERERKAMSKSKKFAVLLFKALDKVSESCEVVDAIYQTLPKSTRKRWDQKNRGLIDNAGQYGLGGCDWKAQAIYYNSEKIDVCRSMLGVLKNHYQDIFIGRLQADRPVNTGNAVASGDKAFAKWLDQQLDETLGPLETLCE